MQYNRVARPARSVWQAHAPPYILQLRGGILCGVCVQKLQMHGGDLQRGKSEKPAGGAAAAAAAPAVKVEDAGPSEPENSAALAASSRPVQHYYDLGLLFQAPSQTLTSHPAC